MTMRSGRLKSSMAAPSRRNSGLDTTAKSASGRVSRMIRSTSSPVPTGTVDFVTTTVNPSRPRRSSRAAVDKGKIRMTVAAPRRGADRDEDRFGARRPRWQDRSKRKAAAAAHCCRRDLASRARRSAFFRPQGLDLLGVRVDANDSVPEIRETGSRHKTHIAGTDHCNVHETGLFIPGSKRGRGDGIASLQKTRLINTL